MVRECVSACKGDKAGVARQVGQATQNAVPGAEKRPGTGTPQAGRTACQPQAQHTVDAAVTVHLSTSLNAHKAFAHPAVIYVDLSTTTKNTA